MNKNKSFLMTLLIVFLVMAVISVAGALLIGFFAGVNDEGEEWPGGSSASGYQNPLLTGISDPYVFLDGGVYYLTAKSSEGIVLYTADSIQGLSLSARSTIWEETDISCPKLWHMGGKWYLTFISDGMNLLLCDGQDPAAGNWSRVARPIEDGAVADVSYLESDGSLYLLAAAGQEIRLAEMESPVKARDAGGIIAHMDAEWERESGALRGVTAFIHDGRVFAVYSLGEGAGARVGYLVADAGISGASGWQKSSVPLFSSSESTGRFGPGHLSFTAENGNDVVIYQDLNGSGEQAEVNIRAQGFYFSQTGLPVLGVPVAD